MLNFEYQNPTKVVFGKGTISELKNLISKDEKILLTYGGGSIKKNGVYDQVMESLKGYDVTEFSGIEPNPRYKTLLKAVDLVKEKKITFVLAVGGGSVFDGSKFIAAASLYEKEDKWEILQTMGEHVKAALPMAGIMTMPATGSEANPNAVVSNDGTQEKLFFRSPFTYPKFSILDPEITFSIPVRQVRNGIVDTFVHVCEQYITDYNDADLHDYMCEAVLKTLVKNGKEIIENPTDYNLKANLMYASYVALNFSLGRGSNQDWSTHHIGHEITAITGLDHAQTLAIVQTGVLEEMIEQKREKLERMGREIFGVNSAEECIKSIEDFYISLGMNTRLSQYENLNVSADEIGLKIKNLFQEKGLLKGELQNMTPDMVEKIVKSRA